MQPLAWWLLLAIMLGVATLWRGRAFPPAPPRWQAPTDLLDEDRTWVDAHMALAASSRPTRAKQAATLRQGAWWWFALSCLVVAYLATGFTFGRPDKYVSPDAYYTNAGQSHAWYARVSDEQACHDEAERRRAIPEDGLNALPIDRRTLFIAGCLEVALALSTADTGAERGEVYGRYIGRVWRDCARAGPIPVDGFYSGCQRWTAGVGR